MKIDVAMVIENIVLEIEGVKRISYISIQKYNDRYERYKKKSCGIPIPMEDKIIKELRKHVLPNEEWEVIISYKQVNCTKNCASCIYYNRCVEK